LPRALKGHFHDANRLHLATETIRELSEGARKPLVEKLTLREYALLAVAVGAALLALLPFLLPPARDRVAAGAPARPVDRDAADGIPAAGAPATGLAAAGVVSRAAAAR
jgi:hypothetical protein